MINTVTNVIINFLSIILGFGYAQQNFFNTTLPTFITNTEPYVAQFKVFLADLMFFVPKDVLVWAIGIVVAATLFRIGLAIVNLIWW